MRLALHVRSAFLKKSPASVLSAAYLLILPLSTIEVSPTIPVNSTPKAAE